MTEDVSGLDRLERILLQLTPEQFVAFRPRLEAIADPGLIEVYERLAADRADAGWRADPMAMAVHLDPTVQDWRFARLLARQLRRAARSREHGGAGRFQVWNVPPQMGKSTWLQRGLLWCLDDTPSLTFQYLTYGNHLAQEASDNVRGWARQHADQLSFDLRPDRQALGRWRTKQGGGVLFAPLGGSVSGFTATGGVIIDDPIKNWQEAHSKTIRDARWNEIRAVAFKRLSEGAFLILAHARFHLDDPSGRMHQLAEELGVEIEFVTLPMICPTAVNGRDYVDPLGRRPGEPLEPARYSLAECQLRRALDGSYMNAALDGQDPQPEQGGEVLREWWRWTATPPERFAEMVSSWDMKLKDKESGDYVVGLCIGRIGTRFWILDMIRGQFSQLQTRVAIATMTVRHPECRRHLIENTGNGPEVITELRDGDPTFVLTDAIADKVGVHPDERNAVQALVRRGLRGLVPKSPKESKLVRARRIIPDIEGGHVTLLEGRAFSNAIVDEWAAFPPKAGGHDDIVDATTQGIDALANSRAAILNAGVAQAPRVVPPPPGARATTGGPARGGTARVMR